MNIKKLKAARNVMTTLGLIFLSLTLVLFFPAYIHTWASVINVILLALLGLIFILPVGSTVLGNPANKLPVSYVLRKIVLSYAVVYLFFFSCLVLLMSTVIVVTPEQLMAWMAASFPSTHYQIMAYPWVMYVFGTLLITGIGYQAHKPKFSGALAAIVPVRALGGFFASVVDYMAMLGFYIGMLVIMALCVLALAKLIALGLGFALDYSLSITMLGVGCALIYLPFSPLWRTSLERIKNYQLSLSAVLSVFVVGLAVFFLMLYGILFLFVQGFADYFASLQVIFPAANPVEQLNALSFLDVVWIFSMVSTAVLAGYWGQYVQGYTMRQAMCMLLLPFMAILLIYAALLHANISQVHVLPLVAWCMTAPQASLVGLVAGAILILGFRQENNFVRGLYWVMPNISGRKLARWRKVILTNVNFIVFSMVFSLLLGIYYVEVSIAIFAVMGSFTLSLAILSLLKYIVSRKLLW